MRQYLAYRYSGDSNHWREFLSCWEEELLRKLSESKSLTNVQKEILSRKSIRFNPAKLEQIELLEKKLGVKLPTSYTDFLKVSNGLVLEQEEVNMFSVDKVNLAKKLYDEVDEWDNESVSDVDYFNYSTEQDVINIRPKYITNSIAVSDMFDSGMYLISPDVIDDFGEWEAWSLGWHLPGAVRFNSFAGLMRYIYYKSIHNPDYDGVYPEELLNQTCAKYLPVEEYKKELK